MAECIYCLDEICTNAACPACGAHCPLLAWEVSAGDGVCRYEEVESNG